MKKLQPAIRSTVETFQASFDPCVVDHVGFLLGSSYPRPVPDVLHVVRLVCRRLLEVTKDRVQGATQTTHFKESWLRGFTPADRNATQQSFRVLS